MFERGNDDVRAVVLRNGLLTVRETPDPVPGQGELLLKTLSTAICASDVHFMARPRADVRRDLVEDGVQTRTLAVDLAQVDASKAIAEATADLDVGFLVYCAGADSNFEPFLANPVSTAEAMIHRNCTVPLQLCHHFAQPMVARGTGGIVVLGSGAGFAGAPNMVAYAATKAFDMVSAEALWSELHGKGVDVLGLILGKTDTPALRQLEAELGSTTAADQPLADAATVDEVVADAFGNLGNGPTWIVGENMRAAVQMMGSVSRNELVNLMAAASAAAMGTETG